MDLMPPSSADLRSNKRQKVSASSSPAISLVGSGTCGGFNHFAVMEYKSCIIRAWYALHIESVDIQVVSNGNEILKKQSVTPIEATVSTDKNLSFTINADGKVMLNDVLELPIQLEITPEPVRVDLESGFLLKTFNKKNYQPIPLKTLLDTAQTGDICLFSGSSTVSKQIRMATHSALSHAAIIYRDDTGVYLFQSDMSSVYDVITNTTISNSTMLNPLQLAIAKNVDNREEPEPCIYRNLIFAKGTSFQAQATKRNEAFFKFIKSVDGHSYSMKAADLFRGLFLNKSKKEQGHYFCSELVATSLQLMGLMKKDKVPNAYTPANFTEFEDADEFKDHLLQGVSYGPELLVTTTLTPLG